MKEFSKEINKKVEKINKMVSNDKEREGVLEEVKGIIDTFADQLINLTKRQLELEEATDNIFEALSHIENELVRNMMAEGIEAACPYCGEMIEVKLPEDDSDEFECPKCHNQIELEMMFDGCCDCDDCDECEHDHCDCGCEDCNHDDCDCGCDDCDCGCGEDGTEN